jgi:hypothetical protein
MMNEKAVSYLIALLCTIGAGIWGLVVLDQMKNDLYHAPFCTNSNEWGTCLLAGAGIMFVLLPVCAIAASVFFGLWLRNLK